MLHRLAEGKTGTVRLPPAISRYLPALALLMAAALAAGCGAPGFNSSRPLRLFAHVNKTVLPDGLTIFSQEDHSSPVVSLIVFYRVGYRNEPAGEYGITHLLAHLMLRGTKRLPGISIPRVFSRWGGQSGDRPDLDYTYFDETLPRAALSTALQIEADRMENAELAPAAVESEKKVVETELQGEAASPDTRMNNRVAQAAFRILRMALTAWRRGSRIFRALLRRS